MKHILKPQIQPCCPYALRNDVLRCASQEKTRDFETTENGIQVDDEVMMPMGPWITPLWFAGVPNLNLDS